MRVAALLFFSGACALVYQTAWLRQFRLIFGASTFATAAVLAIFMAGLGLGSAILGRRADASERPLAFYGKLEVMIAAAAALSQPLLWLISKIYIALGGSVSLGLTGASLVRLLLATLVLGLPTFLMGGTLPAAARAVEGDEGRRGVALLYGANTLGAVFGTLVSTFFLLEMYGNRLTLMLAVGVNLAVGIIAILVEVPPPRRDTAGEAPAAPQGIPRTFVLAAAAITGFAFLLMELVWYRMLSPLLGGTTFMFGLILAVALLGIGLGGAAYSFWSAGGRPTAGAFALTCTLEALAMIVPYALGDRLAVLAYSLRSLADLGFHGSVLTWLAMTLIVVFPAAFIAGIQFPLLIALLGSGREGVGRDVGHAYAWNTAGAIAGSLAGGFGLLPLISAPTTWCVVAVLLAILGVAARPRPVVIAIAALAVAGVTALGPTAIWRHSGIGAGRAPDHVRSRTDFRQWIYNTRRSMTWEADGRESSVALINEDDIAFLVNGKADGSARSDAGTQVMSTILGAALHPDPRTSLVVGLGTGSSAGWLGRIPSMERVDVVELEPVVLHVARVLADVNERVLENPKVRVRVADAREVLLTTRERYDVIFSEPSNPYRAGIASLFTREFYEAVDTRLAKGGIFVQWVQAYDVDPPTIATIYATLGGVFPHIETWSGERGDLLLVAARGPIVYDAAALRARFAQPAYRRPMHVAWRVEGLEGFLSHYMAGPAIAREVARSTRRINTDDRTRVEFDFARTLRGEAHFDPAELIETAQKRGDHRPPVRGNVDWNLVLLNRASDHEIEVDPPERLPQYDIHHRFAIAQSEGRLHDALVLSEGAGMRAVNTNEMSVLGEALADAGREGAVFVANELRKWRPVEADAVIARLRLAQGRYDEAAAMFERTFEGYRRDPWMSLEMMRRTLDRAVDLSRTERRLAPRVFAMLSQRFAAGQLDDTRQNHRVVLAYETFGCRPETVRVLRELEPWVPWTATHLRIRRECYAAAGLLDLAEQAVRDEEAFRGEQPKPLLP